MDKILLIAGNATAGKDTFYKGLELLYGDIVKRYAFADSLKEDINPISKKLFGKNVGELTYFEKEIIRPILVSYGNAMREMNPLHWVEKVYLEIEKDKYSRNESEDKKDRIYVITDCRYENELNFFKQKYEIVKLLYIERYGCFSGIIPPANKIEEDNNKILSKQCDYLLVWNTYGYNFVGDNLKQVIQDIVNDSLREFFEI